MKEGFAQPMERYCIISHLRGYPPADTILKKVALGLIILCQVLGTALRSCTNNTQWKQQIYETANFYYIQVSSFRIMHQHNQPFKIKISLSFKREKERYILHVCMCHFRAISFDTSLINEVHNTTVHIHNNLTVIVKS